MGMHFEEGRSELSDYVHSLFFASPVIRCVARSPLQLNEFPSSDQPPLPFLTHRRHINLMGGNEREREGRAGFQVAVAPLFYETRQFARPRS